jgi:hypothetical protein
MLSGNRTAIIVGINNYKDNANIPGLLGAGNDAREIHTILSNPNIGNFKIPKDALKTVAKFSLGRETLCLVLF